MQACAQQLVNMLDYVTRCVCVPLRIALACKGKVSLLEPGAAAIPKSSCAAASNNS
jgi:hypothetical protein